MTTDSPATPPLFLQKFQAFYELFTEFSNDAAEFHESLPVHDEASRAVFNSLSRIMAFSDQMNVLMSMAREDVRIVDELTSDPVTATWTEPMEPSFYDWLNASKAASPNVH